MQLPFYFNNKLFVATSSWDPKSRISMLQIFRNMEKLGMILPQIARNLYLCDRCSNLPELTWRGGGRSTQKKAARSTIARQCHSLLREWLWQRWSEPHSSVSFSQWCFWKSCTNSGSRAWFVTICMVLPRL